jgi:hypothetical protein
VLASEAFSPRLLGMKPLLLLLTIAVPVFGSHNRHTFEVFAAASREEAVAYAPEVIVQTEDGVFGIARRFPCPPPSSCYFPVVPGPGPYRAIAYTDVLESLRAYLLANFRGERAWLVVLHDSYTILVKKRRL